MEKKIYILFIIFINISVNIYAQSYSLHFPTKDSLLFTETENRITITTSDPNCNNYDLRIRDAVIEHRSDCDWIISTLKTDSRYLYIERDDKIIDSIKINFIQKSKPKAYLIKDHRFRPRLIKKTELSSLEGIIVESNVPWEKYQLGTYDVKITHGLRHFHCTVEGSLFPDTLRDKIHHLDSYDKIKITNIITVGNVNPDYRGFKLKVIPDKKFGGEFHSGASIGTYYSLGYGEKYVLDLTISNKKLFFAAGPVVGQRMKFPLLNEDYWRDGEYIFTGYHLNIKYFPGIGCSPLRFFLQYSYIYSHYTGRDNEYGMSDWYTTDKKTYFHAPGFGFKFEIPHLFYFYSDMGVSIGISKITRHHEDSYYYYDNLIKKRTIESDGEFRIGIGYTIN